jgi:hypothetical protein
MVKKFLEFARNNPVVIFLTATLVSAFNKFLEFARNNPAIISSTATLISTSIILCSVYIASLSLELSRTSAERNARLASLSVIQQIRSRYLDIQRKLLDYDIYNYPNNKRHYSEKERLIIRRYWEEVVFHEYVMCNEFQNKVMESEWIRYKGFIYNALKNEILKQEYAYFREHRTIYDSDPKDRLSPQSLIGGRFFKEIDSLSDEQNWQDVYNMRKADVDASKKK